MKSILNTAYSVLALTLLIIPACVAQHNETVENQDLNSQYSQMLDNAETYTEYKVIKQVKLNSFWQSVQDSIKMINGLKEDSRATINSQSIKIAELKESVTEKEKIIQSSDFEKEHISVLGMDINKSAYSITSLILYSLLLAGAVSIFLQARSCIKDSRLAKANLKELENEFEDYKKNALEKQMKLKRELQTERNKLMDMHH